MPRGANVRPTQVPTFHIGTVCSTRVGDPRGPKGKLASSSIPPPPSPARKPLRCLSLQEEAGGGAPRSLSQESSAGVRWFQSPCCLTAHTVFQKPQGESPPPRGQMWGTSSYPHYPLPQRERTRGITEFIRVQKSQTFNSAHFVCSTVCSCFCPDPREGWAQRAPGPLQGCEPVAGRAQPGGRSGKGVGGQGGPSLVGGQGGV